MTPPFANESRLARCCNAGCSIKAACAFAAIGEAPGRSHSTDAGRVFEDRAFGRRSDYRSSKGASVARQAPCPVSSGVVQLWPVDASCCVLGCRAAVGRGCFRLCPQVLCCGSWLLDAVQSAWHAGGRVIAGVPELPSDGDTLPGTQKARESIHRARCRVPEPIVRVLRAEPQLVAPAVEAFYYRCAGCAVRSLAEASQESRSPALHFQ